MSNASIHIAPNPANQTLWIQSEENELQSIQLFTLKGQEILSKKNIQSMQTVIHLPTLTAGNYVVNIKWKQGHYAQLITIRQ